MKTKQLYSEKLEELIDPDSTTPPPPNKQKIEEDRWVCEGWSDLVI